MTNLDSSFPDKTHASIGSTRKESSLQISSSYFAFIDSAETVNIFAGIYSIRHKMRINLLRGVQRHLDNNSMNLGIFIELPDLPQQLSLSC